MKKRSKTLLILLLLAFAATIVDANLVRAKRSWSFQANTWAQTSAYDTLCTPHSDADYDADTAPFWCESSCSSSAGGGDGKANAKAWIKFASAGTTGGKNGKHDGSGGQWKAGYHPEGESNSMPFTFLAGSLIMRVVGDLSKANLSVTIFDETTGLPQFNGAIFLNGGGIAPNFIGSFLSQYFQIDYTSNSTIVSLVTQIDVMIPAGHDYNYSGEAGGSGDLAESYVYFNLVTPDTGSVGGFMLAIDKFGLLAPYIGLASTILVGTVATAIYVKRVKRRKEKQ